MKKFLLSAFVVVSFVVYSLSQKSPSPASLPISANAPSSDSAPPPDASSQSGGSSSPPVLPTSAPVTSPAPKPKPAPTPAPAPAPKGQYNNGSYDGSTADALYGNLQVQAIISGGKLTDIKFLQYPSDGGHTKEVTDYALPRLKQEAIAGQTANVDIVSGATMTSEAFRQSLADALIRAKG